MNESLSFGRVTMADKVDYMDFLHTINKELNMDDILSKLEEGLDAFESCMSLFPNYDLKEDLEESYVKKENAMVKIFIKTCISFVKKNSVNVKNFISYMKINEEACDNIIENIPVSEINFDTSVAELSQFGFSPDAIKTTNVNSEVSDDSPTEPGGQPEVGNEMLNNSKEHDENIHLSQVDSMDTPIRTPKMKKKRRNKEQRQKRLF